MRKRTVVSTAIIVIWPPPLRIVAQRSFAWQSSRRGEHLEQLVLRDAALRRPAMFRLLGR
ncbi:hypothetical protein [Sinorhizobium meliloti]|uniref:hypothetical protein n=1 Tax=Rhizobium meliloti TaxID=382 RepID=UPI0013E3FBFB